MTVRRAPVMALVPEKYGDLKPYFEAVQQQLQLQGTAITDAAVATVGDPLTISTADAAAATASNPPAGGTGTAGGGYDTAGNRDLMITSLTAVIADVEEIRTQFNALLTELKTEGAVALLTADVADIRAQLNALLVQLRAEGTIQT